MSTKLSRIVEAMATRLQAATTASGYATDIGAQIETWPLDTFGPVDPEPDAEASVFLAGRERSDGVAGERHHCTAQVVVEARARLAGAPQTRIGLAGDLLGDIQRAIETGADDGLEQLLKGRGRPEWASEEIDYADASGDFVTVRVLYDVPHIRRRADPEINLT